MNTCILTGVIENKECYITHGTSAELDVEKILYTKAYESKIIQ
jgi:hypothetical protein